MPIIEPREGGCRIAVKVVPGASRDRIVGPLGDRLKVQVRQAPEKGKANRAVCDLVASALGVKRADVAVVRGDTRPEKALAVGGVSPEEAARRLGVG
ncbi:MAG: DUF167 domain-containing protein [Phycisphaerae bacterium]